MGGTLSGGDRVANGQDFYPQDGLPSRPNTFSKAENEYWTLLMSQIPNDLLRRVDSHQLRTLCELLVLRDTLIPVVHKNPIHSALMSHYLRVVQQIQRLSPLFGLAPLDRRRMKMDAPADVDSADAWETED